MKFDLTQKTKASKPKPRLMLYGEPKIGKTTFATSAPNMVLIATEDGSLGVDGITRLPSDGKCESWQDVLDAVNAVKTQEHVFEWLAIDTLNCAEQLCQSFICNRDFGGVMNTTKGQEGFNSFGKGEKAVAIEMKKMLSILDQIQQKRNMGIILISHVGLHKSANALGPDFYRFGADVSKSSWAMIASWADQIGFACRDIKVQSVTNGKAKPVAIGSERHIVFDGGPALDAGGRIGYEMPTRIPLSWDSYEEAIKADWMVSLIEQTRDLIKKAGSEQLKVIEKTVGSISDESLRKLGKQRLENCINWLLQNQKEEDK